MRPNRWTVWTMRAAGTLVLLVLLVFLGGWLFLRASLAQLDGKRTAPGLRAPVTVERDARGVPLISGSDRLDMAYATGFVHAQERFFQMDLLRRSAAGELAELFGPRALPVDRAHRLHRFRARAQALLAGLNDEDRAFIDRYVAGVNDGLAALSARPFEYALLQAAPRPWSADDSLLVVWAMFFDLQGNQEPRKLARGWLREHASPAQLAFLLPEATEWDAPLDANRVAPPSVPIPADAPSWWGEPRPQDKQLAAFEFTDSVGSNNYALDGSRTDTGAAIVSDDMHLGLQLPNTWYRLALRINDGGSARRLVGVTLPGAPPSVIVGSNGHVAWSFTNSYGDFLDLIALGTNAQHPGQVRTPAGWETPAVHQERILVKGAPAEEMAVRDTSLGPIREAGGTLYALHWVAHDPHALNLNHLKLEHAATVDEALAIAATDGIPAQNFVAGDDRGNIGWTIAGILPRRDAAGGNPGFPLAFDNAAPSWQGLLDPSEYPRVVNPPGGQLSTANNRQLLGEGAQRIGDGGFDLGARNSQLRDALQALGPKAGVADAFRVALDDRALFIGAWRERALGVLDVGALDGHAQRAEFRRLLATSWNGRASTASVGYRLARDYMWALYELVFGAANKEMAMLDPKATFAAASSRWPAVLARLLDAQPAAWLPPGYRDWRQLQLAAIDRVIANLTEDGKPLASNSWGARNEANIAHPISMAVPQLRAWLAAPADQLPGDANMPRVAGPKFGQSERMTVSPGHEEQGLFDMPGGQSGHPLSPFFLAGHEDWVQGRGTPLLPGKAKYTLTLVP
ncbi:penicillin acylase family protein [Massilia horti]|uniref:Penicillin acylase family protein n=1 Tax=Massilia horti TaxID=2562153 RepID=A0A4Y9SLT5_9BURK|nr:penicillin acylase family protein [Massilia horti]TFW27401.1 penicillin acylase family protein [Massilia horti]